MTPPEQPIHYVIEPVHGWWVLPVLLGLMAAVLYRRRAKLQRQPAPVRKHRTFGEEER
jgi:hypothetical protein